VGCCVSTNYAITFHYIRKFTFIPSYICWTNGNISVFRKKLKISICRATIYFKTHSTQHLLTQMQHFCINLQNVLYSGHQIDYFFMSRIYIYIYTYIHIYIIWIFFLKVLSVKSYGFSRSKCFPTQVSIPSQSMLAFCAVCILFTNIFCKGKGKAIPLQAWRGPEGSRRLRISDFMTIVTWRW